MSLKEHEIGRDNKGDIIIGHNLLATAVLLLEKKSKTR